MSFLPPWLRHSSIRLCIRFIVLGLLVNAARAEEIEVVEIDGDTLFAPDRVVEIRLELEKADWDNIRRQRRDFGSFFSGAPNEKPYTYVKANLWIDGIKIESIGLRKKGLFGSSDERRPSIKIKFDEYLDQDPVKGISRLTLNNNKQDATQMSQYLTYKLFREAGVHAPRASFAHVTVNDRDLGIYTHVESIRKPFLTHSFGIKTGALYEGTLTDFYPKTVEKIEVKSNDKKGVRVVPTRLANMLGNEGDLTLAELEQVIDVENFMRYWALEGAVQFWDGYASNQNNYYFYVNPQNGLGYFIPWGADASFNRRNMFGSRGGNKAIYAQSMLTNRLYALDGIPERYRQTMLGLLDQVWIEEDLLADIDRVEELITPHLSTSQQNAARSIKGLRDFISTRREELEGELDAWPANVPSQPRKPMYAVEVGTMKGGFQTTFRDRGSSEETQSVVKDLKVQMEGASILVSSYEITAQEYRAPAGRSPWGRSGGTTVPSIGLTITGRNKTGDPFNLTFVIPKDVYQDHKGEPIEIRARLVSGRSRGGFGGGRGPSRSAVGTVVLDKSGMEPGDAVTGTLDLSIEESKGGFFGRR